AAPPTVARGSAATADSDDDDANVPPPFVRTAPAPAPEAERAAIDRAPRPSRGVVRKPPMVPGSPPAVGGASPGARVEGDAATPPAAGGAPPPLPDAGAGAPPTPAAVPPLARFTLDVLVYSEVPTERLVFINGRKYVEGQAVDTDTVVEQITPEGAIV